MIRKMPEKSQATYSRKAESTMENSDMLNAFLHFMNVRGLNVTQQRLRIASLFFSLPGHHSLEEFYQHVHTVDAAIGQTTVYRTLKLLCAAELAHEIQFGDGISRYEVSTDQPHHDHFLCTKCQKTIEFYDERLEAMQQELATKNGFQLTGHAHFLYGLCAECSAKN